MRLEGGANVCVETRVFGRVCTTAHELVLPPLLFPAMPSHPHYAVSQRSKMRCAHQTRWCAKSRTTPRSMSMDTRQPSRLLGQTDTSCSHRQGSRSAPSTLQIPTSPRFTSCARMRLRSVRRCVPSVAAHLTSITPQEKSLVFISSPHCLARSSDSTRLPFPHGRPSTTINACSRLSSTPR
jgi:hypothetical protein